MMVCVEWALYYLYDNASSRVAPQVDISSCPSSSLLHGTGFFIALIHKNLFVPTPLLSN